MKIGVVATLALLFFLGTSFAAPLPAISRTSSAIEAFCTEIAQLGMRSSWCQLKPPSPAPEFEEEEVEESP